MRVTRLIRFGLFAGIWLLLGPGTAGAQRVQAPADTFQDPCTRVETWAMAAGTDIYQPNPLCEQSRFDLRGSADFAGHGLSPANPTVRYFVTNSGPGDSELELRRTRAPFSLCCTAASPGGTFGLAYWRIQFMAAASRSDWVRNREIAPSLRNAKGGGFAASHNQDGQGGNVQWAGADGTVGLLHSGVQSAAQGCLDPGPQSQGAFPYGFPLLPRNDCPETWGSLGWVGRRWIGPIDNWIRYFNDVGPGNFTFDHWRVPEQYWQTAQRPMTVGDNMQVYGMGSDWGAEVRPMYGNVVPGQSGEPTWDGYPLGLTVSFNAYSFKVPAVSGGYIYEALVINDTEKVYGVPLDYDSLWFGFQYGPFLGSSHVIPERGTVFHTNTGVDEITDCRSYLKPVPGLGNCSNSATSRGFRAGGEGMIVYKSPIGDLRNKHFSNPESPFYAPGHPNAGDTIPANRYGWCANACTTAQIQLGARGLYGVTVADPAAALAGRDPRNMTPLQRHQLFTQYYADDGVTEIFCNTAQPREPGCYNYVVPGLDNYVDQIDRKPTPTWTYSNRPPGAPVGPDTLWIDYCRPPTSNHPARNQCPVLFSDSVSDGTRNDTNAGFWLGAGPFPLKAGDSVPWVIGVFAEPNAAQWYTIENDVMKPGPLLDAWYNFYVNDFYLGPSQPPPPSIISVATQGGSALFGGPEVTLFLDDAAESWRDAFTLKFIEDLRNPAPGTLAAQIAAADPDAADKLEALIDRNLVDTIYIFKSCDLGRSITATGNLRCDPSPARTTTRQSLGNGWQAYAWLTPDAQGRFPKSWSDDDVAGGRQYFYSLVAVTQGVEFETAYQTTSGEVRDTVLSIISAGRTPFSLSTSNPWVVQVYVPLMNQAGSEPAAIEVTRELGSLRWDKQVEPVFYPNADRPGNFRLEFGKNAIVHEYRTAGEQDLDSTVVILEREVLALMPDGSVERLDLPPRRYVNTRPYGIAIGGDEALITRETQATADGTVRITHMNRKSGLLFDADANELLFASGIITQNDFTPGDFAAHPSFRQFALRISDAAVGYDVAESGSFINQTWRYQDELLRSDSWPSVTHLRGSGQVQLTGIRFGTWELISDAPFFGTEAQRPSLDRNNPQSTADAYYALLQQRPVVSRTETGADVLLAVQRDIDPALTADDLIEVKLPFTIRNMDYGADGSPVRIAMLRANKQSSVLLGFAPDTVTADVPPDVWIPGEPLVLLEEVELARTNPDGTLMLSPSGEPQFTTELRVTVSQFLLGCSNPQPRPTCNPLTGPRGAGAPGYVEVRPRGTPGFEDGWRLRIAYRELITSQSGFEFRLVPERVGRDVRKVTQAMLDQVRVVPNPYLGVSAFDYVAQVKRIMFTSLPPSGTIHILTVSGQYVQRLDWEPEDLVGASGDLVWQMNTKEGTEVAPGVYMYVVETTDPETGAKLSRTGKFAIIK